MNSRVTFAIIAAFLLCALLLISCNTPPLTNDEQISLGNKYLYEGNYKTAILAFEAAIEIDSKSVPAYMGIADAYIRSGNLASAEVDLVNGIEATNSEELKIKLDDITAKKTSGKSIEESTTEGINIDSEKKIIEDMMATDFFGMIYDDVRALLGSEHSDVIYYMGTPYIIYDDAAVSIGFDEPERITGTDKIDKNRLVSVMVWGTWEIYDSIYVGMKIEDAEEALGQSFDFYSNDAEGSYEADVDLNDQIRIFFMRSRMVK